MDADAFQVIPVCRQVFLLDTFESLALSEDFVNTFVVETFVLEEPQNAVVVAVTDVHMPGDDRTAGNGYLRNGEKVVESVLIPSSSAAFPLLWLPSIVGIPSLLIPKNRERSNHHIDTDKRAPQHHR